MSYPIIFKIDFLKDQKYFHSNLFSILKYRVQKSYCYDLTSLYFLNMAKLAHLLLNLLVQ